MAFFIRADFPLGIYQGRDRRGVVERYPSTLRLHSALVAGAYSLCRLRNSLPAADIVDLDAPSSAALDWLETNIPDAVSFPRSVINDGGPARAYRDKGTANLKKASELAVAHAAVDGPVIWWWQDEPPTPLQKSLAEMCAEVPYLGEASSPVSLTVGSAEAIAAGAHVRDRSGKFAATDTITLASPLQGRTATLQQDYVAGTKASYPTKSKDSSVAFDGRPRTNESEVPAPWNDTAVTRSVSYVHLRPAPLDDSPWIDGVLIHVVARDPGFLWPPAPEDHVAWAVALHRAIVSRLGPDAPPLVTGKYPDRGKQPPNRLSIQILDGGMGTDLNLHPAEAALLVAIPRGAPEEDVDLVLDALHMIDKVTLAGGHVLDVRDIELVDTVRLWPAPDPGRTRWWFPHPLVIADSRSPRKKTLHERTWTIEDGLRVAVGNVFRGVPQFDVPGKGDDRLIRLSTAVDELGVRVGAVHRAHPLRPGRYVHHMNNEAAVIAVQGLIHLGSLSAERSFIALGQSRHLGGGLLVPFDLPAVVATDSSGPKEDHDDNL
jgi:CRISPR-associated protein Csb2